jgi:hypothetical protein
MEPDELGDAPTAWQKRIGWALVFVGMAVLLYSRWHPIRLGRTGRGWSELFFGVAALLLTRRDIRRGVTSMRWATFDRADNPVWYWVSIATGFIAGLVFVVLSARDLLGL